MLIITTRCTDLDQVKLAFNFIQLSVLKLILQQWLILLLWFLWKSNPRKRIRTTRLTGRQDVAATQRYDNSQRQFASWCLENFCENLCPRDRVLTRYPTDCKEANKNTKIYVGRSTTVHNFLLFAQTMCMNNVSKTFFYWLVPQQK